MLNYILARYLAAGYKLLPLAPQGKKPLARLAPAGLKNATTDQKTIKRWMKAAPTANWGLLPPAGVLVLDIDQPERWPELRGEYPELEQASRQRTPRGGYHVFLRLPQVGKLSTSAGALPGVDLRGLGRAYLVVAPSVVGGRQYSWELPLRAPDQLPEVPAALLERLLPAPPPRPAPVPAPVQPGQAQKRLTGLLEWACQQVATTPQGQRHKTLLTYARLLGGWLHHGLAEAEALAALIRAGMAAGLPECEAKATARDGLAYGRREPLDLPATEIRPFHLAQTGVFSATPIALNKRDNNRQNRFSANSAKYNSVFARKGGLR